MHSEAVIGGGQSGKINAFITVPGMILDLVYEESSTLVYFLFRRQPAGG